MFEQGVFSGGKLEKLDTSKIRDRSSTQIQIRFQISILLKGNVADPEKNGAYSWVKAPRYADKPMEVGVLARTVIAYHAGNKDVKKEHDAVLKISMRKYQRLSLHGKACCKGDRM
jgi:Ni,Fe-hydrogenase I large subunit